MVFALASLPDGRLASGGADRLIRLWDVDQITQTARLAGHDGSVRAIAPLADGRLASGATDNTVRVWDLSSGKELARFEIDAAVTAVAELPDGGIAVGDSTGRLHWLKMAE
jgi:WD40 repeat protein